MEVRYVSTVDKEEKNKMFKQNRQFEGQVIVKENKDLGITFFQQAFGPNRTIDKFRAINMAEDHIRQCILNDE